MKRQETKKSIIPKMAKLFGDSTVKNACALWYCQPKVPAAMQRKNK